MGRKTKYPKARGNRGVMGAGAVAVVEGAVSGGSSSVGFAQSPAALNYVPLMPRREQEQLTGADLRAVHAKADRLVTDVPYALGPLRSVADYLGPAMPKAATEDAKWNKLANDWFREEYWDQGKWDASGKFTCAEAQAQMQMYHDTHGDVLPVFTEDADEMPVIRLIVATAVASPFEMAMRPDWRDGVRVGLHHRHEAWHVLADEAAPVWLSALDRKGYVVDRSSAMMLGNFKVGGVRGRSRMLPVGSTIVQMQQYDNATHDLLNLMNKIGWSLETDAGQLADGRPKPVGGPMSPVAVTQPVGNTAGDVVTLRHYREDFLQDGPAVIAPGAGQKLKMNALDRDLPDLADMRGTDLERIAMAFGLPVQILFCIMSGMFNVTGPNVRLALGRAKTWRDQELAKREPLVKRHFARVMAWAVRTGRVPQPKSDLRIWRSKIQWAKNYTIDEARDVKSDKERLAMGSTTQEEIAAEYGSNAAQNVAEQVEYVKDLYQRLEKDKLPTSLHFPGWSPPWEVKKAKDGGGTADAAA